LTDNQHGFLLNLDSWLIVHGATMKLLIYQFYGIFCHSY